MCLNKSSQQPCGPVPGELFNQVAPAKLELERIRAAPTNTRLPDIYQGIKIRFEVCADFCVLNYSMLMLGTGDFYRGHAITKIIRRSTGRNYRLGPTGNGLNHREVETFGTIG